MRILRRGLNPTRSLSDYFFVVMAMAVVVGALLALPEQATAQSPSPSQAPPPVEQEWSVRDSAGFRSRNLPIGSIFPIRVDGRTLSPTWSSDRSSSSGSSRASEGDKPPLDPKIQFEAEYANKPIRVMREMRVDPKRRAVRILDIFTNTDSQERHVRLDYNTSMSERGNVRYGGVLNQAGESREYGNGPPENTIAALIFAERPDSKALPLFVWGQTNARWPVNIQDVGSSASLNYEGTIPANGKVALLHWVAVAGLDKGVKLERTADLFWKDGRLVDPMVPADIAPLVVNFTPDALKATAAPAATLAQAAGRLVKLEELCGKLSIAREEKDVLWMGKDEHFRGDVTGAGVQLKTDSRTVEIPLAGIAAIRGGGGRGREHRVYLRNGAVFTGRVALRDCRLTGELGELTLDAEALELLLMRVNAEDGKVPPGANGFAELQNCAVHWLVRQEAAGGVQLVTVFGGLPVSFSELWSIARRTEPPFNLVATLAEGSRIHGVAQQPTLDLPVLDADGKVVSTQVRMAEMVRFGAGEILAKEMALPGSESPTTGDEDSSKAKSQPPTRYCWLRDGSLLVGTLTQPSLSVRTGGNEVEVKSEDITRLTLDAANGNLASIELRSGAKMQGELVSESLAWRLGNRTVNLPAGWILELVRKESEAETPTPLPPAPTVRGPNENDPLALPSGIPKANLVEMKLEFPKSTVENPSKIAGTVSLPRLDRCDEESVKKRLSIMVPRGTTNVALKKAVTVSAPDTVQGVIESITDGSAKDDGGEHVALGGGLQWVQIDLGQVQRIWKVMLWHYHRMPVVYEDVIVQVSDDPNFRKDVRTIFNNDHDNSSGLGEGPDTAYVETNYGRLIDGRNAESRYIRFYSRGNSYSEKNDYLEIQVFGTAKYPPNWPSALGGSGSAPNSSSPVSMVTITPSYPKAPLHSAPLKVDPKKFPHVEEFEPQKDKANLGFKAPPGTTLVSIGKPVTSSAKLEKPELLRRVADGGNSFTDFVELPEGLQWVQIDLGAPHCIRKVQVWHEFKDPVVYDDVIVRISDDPDFKKTLYQIYSCDHDNSAGFGQGKQTAYVESNYGRLFEGHNVTGRYVRLYSNGNSKDGLNRYCEVFVWGTRVSGKSVEESEAPPSAAPLSSPSSSAPATPSTPAATSPPARDPSPPSTPVQLAPTSETSSAPSTGASSSNTVASSAVPPAPPKPEALQRTEAAKNAATPNNPLAIPKGMTSEELVEEKPSYPKAMFIGTPVPMGEIPNLEKSSPEERGARAKFLIPRSASEVARGKTVTSSTSLPIIGSLDLVTDGDADAADGCYVELNPGLQWVQIDLGATHHIWKVLLWHFHKQATAYYDVIVQVSDDAKFSKGVQTIFNSDHDNSAGLGKGPDPVYIETNHGRLIDGCEAKGRYIRFYSNGSTANEVNHYIEALVYGTKVKAAAPASPSDGAPVPKPPAPAPAPSAATPPPNDPIALPKGFTEEQLEEVKPRYPKPMYIGHWRYDEKKIPNLERLDVQKLKERVSFRIPKGARVVSNGAKVTASVSEPVAGTLDLVTNEDARGVEANCVDLGPGLQWLQVDLGARHHLWKVLLWHDHHSMRAYFDVVVQVSDDPEFKKGVQTIFNNDHDNSARLGAGADPVYLETCWGRLIDGCGATARHLRFYSNGNTGDEDNHYLEIQVYGTAALASAS